MSTKPDAYLARLNPEKRATLEKIRKAIRAAAPKAQEGMSYGVPAFIQIGRGRPSDLEEEVGEVGNRLIRRNEDR